MIVLLSNGKVRCLDCQREDWTPEIADRRPSHCVLCYAPRDRHPYWRWSDDLTMSTFVSKVEEEARHAP